MTTDAVVSINGKVGSDRDAVVSVFDRGFLYGDSVFEVMRTYGQVPFAETEHLVRLESSCRRVLIEPPVSKERLSNEIRQCIDAFRTRTAGRFAKEFYIRVIITRGSGPVNLDPSVAIDPLRVIIVLPLQVPDAAVYVEGVGIALVRAARATDETQAAGAKASNYLGNLLALREAKNRGAYEAVILGPGGEVIEGASSNVFVVQGGVIKTPPKQAGILAGITRAVVMDVARKKGLTLLECSLVPQDLYRADEVFITSTIREVVPIVRVDDRTIGDGRPGRVTQSLHDAFLDYVKSASALSRA